MDGSRLQRVALRGVGAVTTLTLILVLGTTGHTQHFVLNQYGNNRTYTVAVFGSDGLPTRVGDAIRGDPIPEARHIAWPSAIQRGDQVLIFASVFRERWLDVGLWLVEAASIRFEGIVFSARPDERFGIGPIHVAFDSTRPTPFLLYYLVRGPDGPGRTIAVAESKNGRKWRRLGTVYRGQGADERYGVSPAFLCAQDGRYLLFLMGYPDQGFEDGIAMMAVAPQPIGPFSRSTVMATPDHQRSTIRPVARGMMAVQVDDSAEIQLGRPHLIISADGDAIDVVVPERIDAQGVTILDRSLTNDYRDTAMIVSFASNKIDPSFVWTENGGWYGIFTTFGQRSGLTSEFTFLMKADRVEGPWRFVQGSRAPVFSPYFSQSRYSLENPEPVRTGLSCTMELVDRLLE